MGLTRSHPSYYLGRGRCSSSQHLHEGRLFPDHRNLQSVRADQVL